MNAAPRFDRVARLYQAMERLSFGPMLERCRFAFLPELSHCRRTLVLGDGDGRFVARPLAASPALHATAVDASPAMLRLLRKRAAGAVNRVTAICEDIRTFTPPGYGYDLVATHFFLDCLTAAETAALIARLSPHLAPDALWVVSEFEVPEAGRLRRLLARAVIGGLYAAFRLLTGLAVREIPPWRRLLGEAGFACVSTRVFLGGLLTAELRQRGRTTGGPGAALPKG